MTTTGDAGHVVPLLPFARALVAAGHEVELAAPLSRAAVVQRTGLPLHWLGDPPEAELRPLWAASFELDPEAANEHVIGRIFARAKARAALDGIERIVRRRRPDVIVRESYEFASAVVAERHGIPHVRVATGLASTERWLLGYAGAAADELPLERIDASPYLTLNPPAFEDPCVPEPTATHRFRAHRSTRRNELPDWWPGNGDPLVYVSFGSVAGALDFVFPRLYRAAVEALAELPATILVTTGSASDPAELGPLPANVHVERWVAQADVAPRAAGMVGHGGYGSTLGALTHGLPLAVVPLFADRGRNARRVAALGAGIALPEIGSLRRLAEDGPAAVAALAVAVRRILDDPRYRRSAQGVAASAEALPTVDAVPRLLRDLAAPALGVAA